MLPKKKKKIFSQEQASLVIGMEAAEYYNGRTTQRRTLDDGFGVRNTHNYLKSVLIATYVPKYAHITDLGCGQGGDLLKFKRRSPKSYRGIDVSHNAIEAAARRFNASGLTCRSRFECVDFTLHRWGSSTSADVVSCQFALQYAFQDREKARHTIGSVASSLRVGGHFIGTVPVHAAPSYTKLTVRLPNDTRECIEYSARESEVKSLCEEAGLQSVMWSTFDEFYAYCLRKHGNLAVIMHAEAHPNPENAAFVFKKVFCPRGKDVK
jgi:SAM-dependent methyltransferase